MKNQTEFINEVIFTNFPSGNTRKNQQNTLFNILKKRVFSFKNQLLSGVAGLGIGTVFLVGLYLFFSQLARYGWQ